MPDEQSSPQQLINNAVNALGETPLPDMQHTDSQTIETTTQSAQPEPVMPDALPFPPIPTPEPMIVPTKEKEDEKEEQNTEQPPKKQKKKAKKGILIATLLFFILTLPIAVYYVTQSPQFAEIRSRAAGGSCVKTGVSTSCSSFNCSNFSTASTCSVSGSMCCTWKVTIVPTNTPKPPCKAPGVGCGISSDCCNGVCAGGICQGTVPACKTPGSNCGVSSDCCNGVCAGRICQGTVPACKTPGSNCGVSGDCCNGVCAGGICQGTVPATPTPITGGGSCPANIAACKPGGAYYYEWLPNHVICGTCDRANNFNTCGTWQGESGVWKDKCCGGTCSGSYPWTFENQCLSTKTSNREACFHVEADCNRVQPCNIPAPTSGPNPPAPTNPPSTTNTPVPTATPILIHTPTSTPVLTATPTTTTNTPAPGTCDSSCDTDSNCESGLSCVTSTGVKRCRNATCPDEADCSCPSATATPTTTYYANNSPVPTQTSLSSNPQTPKTPVAGVGPGFIGIISVVGSILLLLVGLAL